MLKKLALTTCLAGMSVAAFAQELPGQDVLQSMVADALPSYWSVDTLAVVASSSSGDVVTPQALIRFEAEATPRGRLFAAAGQEGPFVLVVPTYEADARRTLYGVLDLRYRAGYWSGEADIENPVDDLGRPLDLFDRPALEVGSEDAAARLSMLRDQGVQALVGAHEAELRSLRAAHGEAVARLADDHARRLAEMQTAQSKEQADAEDRGARELAALERKYREELAALTADNAPLLAEAQAERASLLAAARQAASTEMQAFQDMAASELEALQVEHAKRRGELLVQQRQELAEIETRLASERDSLQRQLDAAQDVVELQNALAETLVERRAGAERLLTAFEESRQMRQDFFARLPTNWRGEIRCVSEDGTTVDQSHSIAIDVTGARAGGWDASATTSAQGGGTVRAQVVLQGSDIVHPLLVRVTAPGLRNVPTAFDLEILQDGTMTGSVDRRWTVSRDEVEGTCTYRLSA